MLRFAIISLRVLCGIGIILTLSSRIENGFLNENRFPILVTGLLCGFIASALKDVKENEKGMSRECRNEL